MAALTCVGDVHQQGLMAGIELVQDRAANIPFPLERRMGAEVCRMAWLRGILLRPLVDLVVVRQPLPSTIRYWTSFAASFTIV
jgi:lysine--8-amino-7-oxononanoate aminotransferase